MFSVTNGTCLDSGNGNSLNGTNDPANALGYTTLDVDVSGQADSPLTVTGWGTAGGTFSFVPQAGNWLYAIGLTHTTSEANPDWAVFSLTAGTTSGSWAMTAGRTLSRAVLYSTPAPVPLPAAAWLLLSGLAGMAVVGRRRNTRPAA